MWRGLSVRGPGGAAQIYIWLEFNGPWPLLLHSRYGYQAFLKIFNRLKCPFFVRLRCVMRAKWGWGLYVSICFCCGAHTSPAMNIWAIESRHTMATADAVATETRPHKGSEWWHMVQTCPVGGPPIGRLHWRTKPHVSHLSVLTHFMVRYTFYKVSTAHAQEVNGWWKSEHVKWGECIIKWLTKAPLPPASTLIRALKTPLFV